MTRPKKLIEVALPLEAINKEASREKSIRHGHPSTLHLWWARRPLAACRAVLFASLVDDPSGHPERFPTEEAQERERQRLFRIIEELVKWENSNNDQVLEKARKEILKSTGGNPPPVLDPFCGGGSIPLEAQRLGLKAYASDLNPVAVLITKAMIEIPPKFAGRPPVNPDACQSLAHSGGWRGAAGLAEDVRYYGQWMREEAQKRIGHLYPKVRLPKDQGGGEATVIAWLWARTVKCPNPACGATMPLARSFWLSTRTGKKAWVEPVVDRTARTVRFEVKTGNGAPPDPPKISRGAKFRCLVCDHIAQDQHIKNEALAGRMSTQLMAIVAEGHHGRIYLLPLPEHEAIAVSAQPEWSPTQSVAYDPRSIWCIIYGLNTFEKLFTPRQLVALTTFSDLVSEAREKALRDAISADLPDDDRPLHAGGQGAAAYADAVATYLAFAIDKMADTNSTLCTWQVDPPRLRATFGRQALPMTWDFSEANIFGDAAGDYQRCVGSLCEVLERLAAVVSGEVRQQDAKSVVNTNGVIQLISTDPPYYDNIGYADLSDFFYVWLRRSLSKVYPDLFGTMLVPKTQELVATPHRFDGDREEAQRFFEEGLGDAFARIHKAQHPDFPFTVYYAFKQAESNDVLEAIHGDVAIASTGWETMLEGLIHARFSITGTWPMRSELATRNVGRDTNALASSIVLVCRPRSEETPSATRREFVAALRRELPAALRKLQHGNIAPVDFAQAAIGPGMAVFSRYARILEADGRPMRVRTALQLINQELDSYLAEQEGELDTDTRFCVAWFEQRGMEAGPFGEADVLARAKNTSVEGLAQAGVLAARAGKVRLLGRQEYPEDWNPGEDRRLAVWEAMQHLIRALEQGGEVEAARLANQLGGGVSEEARALAYRLYALCERKGWAQEALAYNTLVVAWSDVQARTASVASGGEQGTLDF